MSDRPTGSDVAQVGTDATPADAALNPRATSVTVDPQQLVALAVDAARNGDTETLARALALGVPVNSTSPRGDGLLMLACYYGHTGAVNVLLDNGAKANQPDGRGQSPLSGVAFKGLIEVAELLVAGGAVVDAPSADGRTALTDARR